MSFNITNSEECYNGTSVIKDGDYAKNVAGTSAIVNEQLYVLTDLTDKLKKAYQGQEVEMVDDTGKIIVTFCSYILKSSSLIEFRRMLLFEALL